MNHWLFILLFLGASIAPAQNLRRQAWMGVKVKKAPEPQQSGLEVLEVLGGTGAALKLQAGDILVQLQQKPLNEPADLRSAVKPFRDNDPLELHLIRKGKPQVLKGVFVGKPYETHPKHEVIYSSAPFKGGQVRTIIQKPRKTGKMPALLFIPGYTCMSLDNLPANDPYKHILDAFADSGFVTMRVEKSGMGDSENTPECESCDLYDEIANFEAGLKQLKALPYVDSNRIVLYGHSMGGVVAPAVAARNKVAGVMVYGTVLRSWFEYMIEMYRLQNALAGMDPLTHEQSVRDQYALCYDFFIGKKKLDDLAKNPRADSVLRASWEYSGNNRMFGRNAEYWRQIQDIPLIAYWRKAQTRVLVQFGQSDFQAFSADDHRNIAATVNYYHPHTAVFKSYPNTDHFMARSGSMQEAWDLFAAQKYDALFEMYNADVGRDAVNWSLEAIKAGTVQHE